MTCVAMALALIQTRRQIGPMQAEIATLRTDLGYLTIDDPAQVHAIQVNTGDPLVCQWRIFLPPGRSYRIRTASGFLPDQSGPTKRAWWDSIQQHLALGKRLEELPSQRDFWFAKVNEMGVGDDVGLEGLQGEFSLEARLVKNVDRWEIRLQPGHSTVIHQPNGDWLSDGRMRTVGSGDVPMHEPKLFPADERILLMYLRRPVFTDGPNRTWSATHPTGDADSVILWLEPESTKREITK
jgi:hypothetical protein